MYLFISFYFASIDITKSYHENNISYQSQFSSEKQYKNYSNFNQEQLIKRRNPTLPPIDRYISSIHSKSINSVYAIKYLNIFIMTENHYNNLQRKIPALQVMTFIHQVAILAKYHHRQIQQIKNNFVLKGKRKNQCLLIRI